MTSILPAGNPHGHGCLPGWNNDPNPTVAAATHGPASRVHHETHQEPNNKYTYNMYIQCFRREEKYSKKIYVYVDNAVET